MYTTVEGPMVRKLFIILILSLLPAAFIVVQKYRADTAEITTDQTPEKLAYDKSLVNETPDISEKDGSSTTINEVPNTDSFTSLSPLEQILATTTTTVSVKQNSSTTILFNDNKTSIFGTNPTTTNSNNQTIFGTNATTTNSNNQTIFGTNPTTTNPATTNGTNPATTNGTNPTTTNPATTNGTNSTTTQQTGRQLVFAEEFNTFNSSIWQKENSTYGDGNNEAQCYVPELVSVSGGSLILKAQKNNVTCPGNRDREYESGMVRSSGVTFSPGQSIEYRIKLTPNDEDNQAGLWPSLWASSWAGGGWPTGGEWDGFEVMTAKDPKRVMFSLHYTNSSGNHGSTKKAVYSSRNFSEDWHIMRFDYGDDGTLVYHLDGNIVQTVTNADTIQGWPAPFNSTITQLKVNLALGGNPGAIDDRALPATYQVDYIRIYDM